MAIKRCNLLTIFWLIYVGYHWVIPHSSHAPLFFVSGVAVHLSSRGSSNESPLKPIFFCSTCPMPQEEGSMAIALNARHGLQKYMVTGDLVYSIPNHLELSKILNPRQIEDRVALVDRGGGVSFLDKIFRAESYGALAVIIVDDQHCNIDFSFCGVRAGSAKEGGFAAQDDEYRWNRVSIPVVLVSFQTGEKLKSMMRMKVIEVPKVGYNNATLLDEEDEKEFGRGGRFEEL